MKKLALITLGIIELLFLKQWFICAKFADQFYFSAFDLKLRLIEAIHNDGGISLSVVRIFHNKITGTILDIYNSETHYWDPTFLVSLLSFSGIFGLACGIWYLFQGKCGKWIRIVFAAVFILPIVEILVKLHLPFVLQLGLIAIPLLTMSFVGWWHFLESKKIMRYFLFFLLMTISLVWLSNTSIKIEPMFCLK